MKKKISLLRLIILMLIGIFTTTLLPGCGGGVEDRPVFVPLTENQKQELITKDFDYGLVVEMVEGVDHYEIRLTPAEKKEFAKLTYRRLKDFIFKWTMGEELELKKQDYGKQWDTLFDSYVPKVDAINDHWLKFIENYKPENYLKIELVDITDKEEVFIGYVQTKLRLTPLKGTISDVDFNFGLDGSMMNRNNVTYKESFSSPVVVNAWMKFNYGFDINASKVNDLPIKELLQEYPLETRITSLKSNGKTIDYSEGYLQVPGCVRGLWEKMPAKGKEWKSNYDRIDCYERVMSSLVDTTMAPKYTYVNDNIKKEAYEDDNLAATYYYDIVDKHKRGLDIIP